MIIEDWRLGHANRLHSTHGGLTPTGSTPPTAVSTQTEFALRWSQSNQPKPHDDWATKRVPLNPSGRSEVAPV